MGEKKEDVRKGINRGKERFWIWMGNRNDGNLSYGRRNGRESKDGREEKEVSRKEDNKKKRGIRENKG